MKNKKSLIIAGAAVLLLGIGVTVAYNMDLIPFVNRFEMAKYQTEYTDTFTSPTDWKPCDTTPKTITITNKGNVDVSARVKLSDYWKDKDGNDLADLKNGSQKLTVINFHDGWENKWDYVDGWYVYKTNLAPNETTEPLIDSVTLSCDANLAGEAVYTDNGQTGESGTSPYLGASFHIEATLQTIQADAKNEWVALYNATANRVNSLGDYQIDFSKRALKSDVVATANGYGVNATTEKGQTVYYYRGDVDNNYVIWANLCWRIIRTTYSGGTKVMYSGEPTIVGDKQQCPATNEDPGITLDVDGEMRNTFSYNDIDHYTFAAYGYMYGDTPSLGYKWSGTFTFSDGVTKNGDTYDLNLESGHYIRGSWSGVRISASDSRFHYFCTNGATRCNEDSIAYAISFDERVSPLETGEMGAFICAGALSGAGDCFVYYMSIGGYNSFEDALAATNSNAHDSAAKETIDAWFEAKHLNEYNDYLEDAIFCNDRRLVFDGLEYHYAAYNRMTGTPLLDCVDKNDAFTESDTINGNGALKYRVGLLSEDEANAASVSLYLSRDSYGMWVMSPSQYLYNACTSSAAWNNGISNAVPRAKKQLRPVVSLKSGTTIKSGNGQKTSPYIIE